MGPGKRYEATRAFCPTAFDIDQKNTFTFGVEHFHYGLISGLAPLCYSAQPVSALMSVPTIVCSNFRDLHYIALNNIVIRIEDHPIGIGVILVPSYENFTLDDS
jgi:hypothetical protein